MTTKLDPKQQAKITADATEKASEAATKAAEKKAGEAAKSEVEGQLKTAFGVTTVSLDAITTKLKAKLLDDAIDFVGEDVKLPSKTIPGQTVDTHTHRYTIHVPDQHEQTVLNLGHGDTKRDLPDAGISARTASHAHLHTTSAASSSFIALGGPTTAKRDELVDPKKVLAANNGIGAITNGHLWAEAQGQLNLASHTNQAVLRAHQQKVRVQADKANVEVGSGKNVVVGGVDNVSIVAGDDVAPGDNAYGTGFDAALQEKAFLLSMKDAISVGDIATAAQSVLTAMGPGDVAYVKGANSTKEKPSDITKDTVDAAKFFSSAIRWLLGKKLDGQVKITAQNFASISGGMGASMFGNLSASVTSLVSASVVGGTASLKGLKWASVWAKAGVSMRTVKGSASIKSEKGKVSLNGHEEVTVVSAGGLNMGGDMYAELKSLKGYAYVTAPETKICAGEGAGTGVLLSGGGAYFGTVSSPNEATCAEKPGAFVKIGDGPKDHKGETKKMVSVEATEGIVTIKAKGSFMTFKKSEICASGKKITFG